MKPTLTFREWLREYENDDGIFGDFARDACADEDLPVDGTREEYEEHLTRLPEGFFQEVWQAYEDDTGAAL